MKKELTPQELMNLSRAYHDHKEEIKALILAQLERRRPQILIARDFGIERSNISHLAKRNGIYYTKHDREK